MPELPKDNLKNSWCWFSKVMTENHFRNKKQNLKLVSCLHAFLTNVLLQIYESILDSTTL